MAAEPAGLALLAHTARMAWILAENPEHARAGDYHALIARNRHQWAALTDAERAAALEVAPAIHDMTPERIAAAIAALEG